MVFFAGTVDEKAVRALNAYEGPELVHIAEREIYVYYAAGMGQSKLQLKGSGAARNWNTVSKAVAMATTLRALRCGRLPA